MKRIALTTLAAAVMAVLSFGVVSAPPAGALLPTTTTLSLSASSVVYGSESAVTFTANVSGVSPGGTVTIETPSTQALCTMTLPATTCSTTNTFLTASDNPYQVSAHYMPAGIVNSPSDSSPQLLTVTPAPTTTTLGPLPSVTYGQESSVVFTAGVTPQEGGTPTGTVTVQAGTTFLCAITLPATTCQTSDDPVAASVAPASVTAVYSGDTNFSGSTSSPQDLTVSVATTTLSLALSSGSVVVGDESALLATATLTPEFGGTPTGAITVTAVSSPASGSVSTTFCTITLPATPAVCSPATGALLPVSGSQYSLTAAYSGDANFSMSSTTTSLPLTVTNGNSSTTLTIAPTTVAYGDEENVTFGANVTSTDPGTPTGTVAVMAGPTTLCSITLPATTCTTSATALPAAGAPYQVVASYLGDEIFTPSASDAQDFTVQQATTTTSLTLPPGTSVVYGNEGSITFQPTVTPAFAGTPTGTVTVLAGTTTLCTYTLPSGSGCSAPATALPASGTPYMITASYTGDANFQGSASSTPQDLTVDQASTTTTLVISPPTVTYGNESSVQFTATVKPQFAGTPTGTVAVMEGTTTLCTITLPATTCSTADDPLNAAASPYTITASYAGDANFIASTSSNGSLTVDQATTGISLQVTPSSVSFGNESSVAFSVILSQPFPGGTPTGLITVATLGSSPVTLCTIALPATNFTCNTSDDALAASGTPYQVTASYSGDTNLTNATSTVQDLTVTALGTTTSLTPSASTVVYGNEQTITFAAAVTPDVLGGPAPTGTVTVATPTTTLCSFDVSVASSCTASATALGVSGSPYAVTAAYSGDTNYGSSTSSPSLLTITQASTTAGVSLSSSTVTYGNEQAIMFTATLTPQFSGTPTGSVTVATTVGSTPVTLCTITLPAMSCTTLDGAATNPLPAQSTYGVTASYGGDANFTGSAPSPAQGLTVGQAGTTTGLMLVPSTVAYGNESTVVFTATVTPQYPGSVPTGTVTVATASTGTVCTITLPATTCTMGDGTLAPSGSAYSVTATYAGDTNFTGSASAASDLTITGGTSTTAFVLSTPSVTYGNETSVSALVTVTPLKSGTPSGTATVSVGTTTLCVVSTLTNGAGSCTVTGATALAASGTPYNVVATYSGDTNFTKSASSPSTLAVTQATTGTALSISPSSVTYNGESAATFTATLTPQFAGTPTGSVTVAVGSTTLCSITLPATGCTSSHQAALNAGGYTVTASYHGDQNFQSSSGSHGFTVNQAAPSSPNIANVPAGAAEQGSFTASVATNGDGATSVVSDTTGTCTVGGDGHTVSFLVEGACTLTPQVSSGTNYTAGTGSPQTFTILPGPRGYWLVGSDGGIFSFGQAHFYGSMGGIPLQRPVVGITPTHDKHGYWLVASDGGIFSFGDSNYYGSIPGLGIHPAGSGQPNSLDAPIVGMVPSSDGNGYFMVAADGGVFAFGDAKFAGSCPGIGGCAGTAVAVMPDQSGNGYWLVTTAGNIYAFGDAPFFGAPPPQSSPVVNAVATTDGHGYWILYANGAVLPFGDAGSLGNPLGYVNSFNPATSIFPTSDDLGYWVASAKGDVFTYGNAPFLGSMSATPLNGPIIAAFGF